MRRSLSLLVLCCAFVIGGGPAPAWAAPPANDSWGGAQTVGVPSHTGPVDTTEATIDADDADVGALCGYSGASNTVWYRFVPDDDAQVRVDTSASDHGVVGAVVTGAPGSFSTVSCFIGSTVITGQAGTAYYVLLADATWDGGGGGMLTLDLTTGEAPTVSFAVTGASVVKRTGAVTLMGTATCSEGAWASISGSLSQAVGRVATIQGSFDHYLACTGTPQEWSATVQPYSGRFAGGKATLSYGFWASNEWGSGGGSDTRTVQLRAK